MFIKKHNAFTLIEMIVVVMMIGILMMATTTYLGGTDEKRKTIEAQGCANSIGGEINNFVFYTLTSKNLKLSESETKSPNYYIIEFTGGNDSYCSSSGEMCDKINLSYSTGDEPTDINIYKTITIPTTCQGNNQPLRFFRSGSETSYIIMNKGFSPKSITDKHVFYLKDINGDITFIGDIIVGLCLNKECIGPKEIGKFIADARSQTVSFANCKFYDNDNPTKCKTREGCQIYDPSDPTSCLNY